MKKKVQGKSKHGHQRGMSAFDEQVTAIGLLYVSWKSAKLFSFKFGRLWIPYSHLPPADLYIWVASISMASSMLRLIYLT